MKPIHFPHKEPTMNENTDTKSMNAAQAVAVEVGTVVIAIAVTAVAVWTVKTAALLIEDRRSSRKSNKARFSKKH